MFLSPGVTPWKTTLPGVVNGANNPGIRVFEYDTQTLLVKVRQKPAQRGFTCCLFQLLFTQRLRVVWFLSLSEHRMW